MSYLKAANSQDVMQPLLSLRGQMTAVCTLPDGTVRTLPSPGDLVFDAVFQCVATLADRLERAEAKLAAFTASVDTAAPPLVAEQP